MQNGGRYLIRDSFWLKYKVFLTLYWQVFFDLKINNILFHQSFNQCPELSIYVFCELSVSRTFTMPTFTRTLLFANVSCYNFNGNALDFQRWTALFTGFDVFQRFFAVIFLDLDNWFWIKTEKGDVNANNFGYRVERVPGNSTNNPYSSTCQSSVINFNYE